MQICRPGVDFVAIHQRRMIAKEPLFAYNIQGAGTVYSFINNYVAGKVYCMLKNGTRIKTVFNEYSIQTDYARQGGNGTVFRAIDDLGKVYAVKVIDRTRTSKEKLKRFHNEIAFCSNNSHENIVPIIDRGTY